jgi:hypothetical protein
MKNIELYDQGPAPFLQPACIRTHGRLENVTGLMVPQSRMRMGHARLSAILFQRFFFTDSFSPQSALLNVSSHVGSFRRRSSCLQAAFLQDNSRDTSRH